MIFMCVIQMMKFWELLKANSFKNLSSLQLKKKSLKAFKIKIAYVFQQELGFILIISS